MFLENAEWKCLFRKKAQMCLRLFEAKITPQSCQEFCANINISEMHSKRSSFSFIKIIEWVVNSTLKFAVRVKYVFLAFVQHRCLSCSVSVLLLSLSPTCFVGFLYIFHAGWHKTAVRGMGWLHLHVTGGIYTDIWLSVLCKLPASNLAEGKFLTFEMFIFKCPMGSL